MQSTSRRNPNLEIASYLLIKKGKEKYGKAPTGVFFNKLMFLTYKKIGRDINIVLPHCWYRYGDETVRQCLPSSVSWFHQNANLTTVDWCGSKPFFQEADDIELLDSTIQGYVDQYHDKFREMIFDVYQFAPFDFQRKILELRDYYYDIERSFFDWEEPLTTQLSKNIVKETFDAFPEKNFPKLIKEKRIISHAIDEYIETESPNYNTIKDLTINFWFLFCYYLRVHEKANENVPRGIIKIWRESLDYDTMRFKRFIADILIKINNEKEEGIYRNSKEIYKEILWKINDDKESNELFEEFYEDIPVMKKTLKTIK